MVGILLIKIEIFTQLQLELTKNEDDFEKDYFLIELPKVAGCCKLGDGCLCNVKLYKLRPNAFAFIKSMSNFFEVICFSRLSTEVILALCLQFEERLNNFNSACGIQTRQVYFKVIYSNDYFVQLPNREFAENLQLLLSNRNKKQILFMSTSAYSIMNAVLQGFAVIPILPCHIIIPGDYQLLLVEQYLLRIKYTHASGSLVRNDFEYLTNYFK